MTAESSSRMLKKLFQLRSHLKSILNGDPGSPRPLGGAHLLGAPYSSHRAPQRVRLRPCWKSFLSILRPSLFDSKLCE